MSQLRIRIELKRGSLGIPLERMARVSNAAAAFFQSICKDLRFPDNVQWLAENFGNGSVFFDCRLSGPLEKAQTERARRVLPHVLRNDYGDSEANLLITPRTRGHYARIADPNAPDETVRLGLYNDGESEPKEWFALTTDMAREVACQIAEPRESFGEIQGVVHALFKEAKPPYLKVRELCTGQIVNCYFESNLYRRVVEVLEDPHAVIFVEGRTKEDRETGRISEIHVTDFRLAPAYSEEDYRNGLGSIPDYTGGKSTEESIREVRDG